MLDSIQRGVVEAIVNGEVSSMYLTGEGGTGKSEIIKTIVSEGKKRGKKVIVLAPTNTAANNIGGTTIHKAFGLNLEINEDATAEDEVHKVNLNREKLEMRFMELRIRPSNIVIIDEISMGGGMLARVISMLREYEKERNGDTSTLLLVGDPKQLPPVKDKAIDWGKKCSVKVELTKNYRTFDPNLAREIAHFRDTHDHSIVSRLPTVTKVKKLDDPEKYTFIAYKNSTLSALQNIIHGDITKWVKPGDMIQAFGSSNDHVAILGEESFPYYVTGDDVMVVSKPTPLLDYEDLYEVIIENPKFKGCTVKTTSDYAPPKPTLITGDYRKYKALLAQLFHPINIFKKKMVKKYGVKTAKELKQKFTRSERQEWGKLWTDFLRVKNLPFARNSKFITAHKAQGKSIDNVCVMWDEMDGDKLKYVAISRARKNLVLVTTKG